MKQDVPLIVCVAPNGARKNKSDHASIPITPDELAIEAENCMKVGVSMIHLHVRDEHGRHSIDPDLYRAAIATIRRRVGDGLIIQTTTEAVGIYSPAEQMAAVRDLKPEAVSLGLRELCPEGGEDIASEFFKWVLDNGIAPQYILYSVEDIERFIELHGRGVIPDKRPHLLLVLGRYSQNLTSEPEDLLPMITALESFVADWAVCAFGPKEADCAALAARRGGHCRLGFENNMSLPDGSIASDNAALIKNFAKQMSDLGRNLATTTEAREILGMK